MSAFYDSPRDIYTVSDVMGQIPVMKSFEQDKFSDIPGWTGLILSWTEKAILLCFTDSKRPSRDNWFPYSTLRKAEDDQSIYASNWILEKKGL